ncbi:MAG: glycosyltransferase family 2 protein [Coriobacteriia bacterium]
MAQLALEPRPYRLHAVPRVCAMGPGPLSVIHAEDAPRVSVVIAAWDEEESLGYVLPRLPRGIHEVILVDGNSTDRTVETALELRPDIKIVFQPGKGKGDALRAGFNAARGDIVIAIDADGSTDPIEIPAFVGALLAGADYVKGSRFIPGGGTDDMTFTRKMGNLGLMILCRILFGTRYTDLNYGYTGFWLRELHRLDLRSDGFEIETEMNIRAAIAGLHVVEVASFEGPRVGGVAHLVPLTDGWRVLMEILRQRVRPAGEALRNAGLTPVPDAEQPC